MWYIRRYLHIPCMYRISRGYINIIYPPGFYPVQGSTEYYLLQHCLPFHNDCKLDRFLQPGASLLQGGVEGKVPTCATCWSFTRCYCSRYTWLVAARCWPVTYVRLDTRCWSVKRCWSLISVGYTLLADCTFAVTRCPSLHVIGRLHVFSRCTVHC